MSAMVCVRGPYGLEPFNVPPHGYGQRGRYALPVEVTDREGNPYCRWCLGPVKPPRQTWCSPECVHEGRLRIDWNYICQQIRARDEACVFCGGCTWRAFCGQGLREHCQAGRAPSWWSGELDQPIPWACRIEQYFEVDHIVPVVEGGTDNPDNLRLLCRPCHLERTRAWRAERSAARREAAALESRCGVQAALEFDS